MVCPDPEQGFGASYPKQDLIESYSKPNVGSPLKMERDFFAFYPEQDFSTFYPKRVLCILSRTRFFASYPEQNVGSSCSTERDCVANVNKSQKICNIFFQKWWKG